MIKRLLILTFLLIAIENIYSQTKEVIIENVLGCWILSDNKNIDKKNHDTIIFKPDFSFSTRIFKDIINIGDWKLKNGQFELKACLHASDNSYKCRDHDWTWNIKKINSEILIIVENETDTLEYKKIFNINNVIKKDIETIISDTLFAIYYRHPFSRELTIYPDGRFIFGIWLHSFLPKVDEISGSIILKSKKKIKLIDSNNKVIRVFKKKKGYLIEKRTFRVKGRKLKIRGKITL